MVEIDCADRVAQSVGQTGRSAFSVATMPQAHFFQQWFWLSVPAMGEALDNVLLYREFAGLDERKRVCLTKHNSAILSPSRNARPCRADGHDSQLVCGDDSRVWITQVDAVYQRGPE